MTQAMHGEDNLEGNLILCQECYSYLTETEHTFATVFPAFVWKMLTNECLLGKFRDHLWALVPN